MTVHILINGLASREEFIISDALVGPPNGDENFLWREIWFEDLFRRSLGAVDDAPSLGYLHTALDDQLQAYGKSPYCCSEIWQRICDIPKVGGPCDTPRPGDILSSSSTRPTSEGMKDEPLNSAIIKSVYYDLNLYTIQHSTRLGGL
ncbi:hypothetical protein TNCV_4059911 [Trichonephila clavipes]|nr:hypothetical protein TNCV_4059911 [Trichonephila clavipes]